MMTTTQRGKLKQQSGVDKQMAQQANRKLLRIVEKIENRRVYLPSLRPDKQLLQAFLGVCGSGSKKI